VQNLGRVSLLLLALLAISQPAAHAVRAQNAGRKAKAARRLHSPHNAHASGGGIKRPAHTAQKDFIYVYNMPSEFTEDLTTLPVQWHPEQYDYDQVTYSALETPE